MTRGHKLAVMAGGLLVFVMMMMLSLLPDAAVAAAAAAATVSSTMPVGGTENYSNYSGTPARIAIQKGEGKQRKLGAVKENALVLTKLIVMARHGHRTPNAAYWTMCPNDIKNRYKYDMSAEDLTGLGMKEEYDFGGFLRNRYRHFIGLRFNRSLHFFRAVGEPRILQSSLAVSQGLFPDGFGPGGYLPGRPQFVPIFSDMDTHEYLLDDVPCFRRAEADMHHWLKKNLDKFGADTNVAEVVAYMKKVCGVSVPPDPPLYAFLKTVSDGMTFNADYGMRVCGGRVTSDTLFKIRNVSLQLLMSRLYHTDEQQTYTAVDLPRRFLQMMKHAHTPMSEEANNFSHTKQTSVFYFVHREALYAFAQFFGFMYYIPGLPHGELPVASALLMERLVPAAGVGKSKATVYVKFVLWTPNDGTSTIEVPQCKIRQLCELDELQRIYDARVARTGTWEKLCNYTPSELGHETDIR